MKAVVIGLGYVGLPLAHAAAMSGVQVTGLDVNQNVVDAVNSGISHIGDLSSDEISAAVSKGFHATTDPVCITEADVVVICVPTPLDKEGHPDLAAVMSAATIIQQNLSVATTVILESTTYPGTTEEILLPLFELGGLECGKDFHLAFSPERIDPGNSEFGIRNTPKVIGGVTLRCSESAKVFYENFVEQTVIAKGTREAETAKLLENTYRHINIALVNELAQLSNQLGIDIWDVIECASTKPFGFQPFWPSAGVGGHCIPIDPNYLAFKVRDELDKPFRFIELAEEINHGMPGYVASRISEMLPMRGARVCLLGVTYKQNISDQRESPAVPLAKILIEMGANISYYDPFVKNWTIDGVDVVSHSSLNMALNESDVVVILQSHKPFVEAQETFRNSVKLVFDATGKFVGENITRL
jgi:UDP-N-acetyl-D-glucosamine dehydrogenase